MAVERMVYQVAPDGDIWVVKKEGSTRPSAKAPNKNEAVARGKELAQKQAPSLLKVYKKDGAVQKEYSFEKVVKAKKPAAKAAPKAKKPAAKKAAPKAKKPAAKKAAPKAKKAK